MSIGIGIQVDARQVEQARKNIEALNGSMQQTESLGNLGIDDKHLSNVAGLVVKIREDIRRMQSIANEGNRKGGLVDAKQLGEAGKISERLLETFGSYVGKVSLARDELKKLIREKDALVKKEQELGRLDPFERQRLGMLNERIDSRQRLVNRHSERADEMRMRLNAANQDIGGFGVADPGGGGLAAMFSRMGLGRWVGLGALAYLGSKAVGSVRSGMSLDQQVSHAEADLVPRAGSLDARGQSMGTHGYGPVETMAILDALNRTGGYRRDDLSDLGETAKMFARGRGVDVNTTANYMGTVGAYMSADSKKLNDTMEKLRNSIVQGGAEGRAEEFMNRNLQLLSRIAEGRGGMMTAEQAAFVTGFQGALWGGQTGVGKGQSGQNIVQSLDAMIRGGGKSKGEQLMFWEAYGGNNIKSPEDYWKFKERLDEGMSERNLRDIYKYYRTLYGTDRQGNLSVYGKLAMQEMTGLTTSQINEVVRHGDKGFPLAAGSNVDIFGTQGSIATDAEKAKGLRGNIDRDLDARAKTLEYQMGTHAVDVSNQVRRLQIEGVEGALRSLQNASDFWESQQLPANHDEMKRLEVQGGRLPTDAHMGGSRADSAPRWFDRPEEFRRDLEAAFTGAIGAQKDVPQKVIIVNPDGRPAPAMGSGY